MEMDQEINNHLLKKKKKVQILPHTNFICQHLPFVTGNRN